LRHRQGIGGSRQRRQIEALAGPGGGGQGQQTSHEECGGG
jgi:hypothetical protein